MDLVRFKIYETYRQWYSTTSEYIFGSCILCMHGSNIMLVGKSSCDDLKSFQGLESNVLLLAL